MNQINVTESYTIEILSLNAGVNAHIPNYIIPDEINGYKISTATGIRIKDEEKKI